MIRYILTKIKNKYKLYLCLILGIVAIVMIFAMIMMFRSGSQNKLIQKGFVSRQEKTGKYPASLYRTDVFRGGDVEKMDNVADSISSSIGAYEKSWNQYLELPVIGNQRLVIYRNLSGIFSYRGTGHIDVGFLEDGLLESQDQMKDHYEIMKGGYLYDDISDITAEGIEIPEDAIPCLVSNATADKMDLVVGELIQFKKLSYLDDTSDDNIILTLYINGIVREKENDYFWNESLEKMGALAIVDKKDFDGIVKLFPKDIYYEVYEDFDYRYIRDTNVDDIDNYTRQFDELDTELQQPFTEIILDYREEKKAVGQMLYVIVLPIIVLVLIFIGMISFRIIDSENGELTTLRNRGLSKTNLIGMYLTQSFILALFSLPIGVGAGFLFGKLMAGMSDFMTFSREISVKDYGFNLYMVIAGAIAAFIAMIIMMLPVFLFFIRKKTRRNVATISVWEKYFLDIILLAVSIYLLVNYNKQIGILSDNVINGEGIDPVIFINSTLFLFACGMLMLRLIFYAVKLIYHIGKKRFSPAVYAGILQIMRTRKSSGVISIFLVMTVAMSLFNANMARTINANKAARLEYECGTDARINEHWKIMINQMQGTWKYVESDVSPYQNLKASGDIESYTKVVVDNRTTAKNSDGETADIFLMGIHTKEFGETARLKDGLTNEHWFNALNELGQTTNGAIISKNLADKFNVKVGDTITVGKLAPRVVTSEKIEYANTAVKVVAIVEAFPGYDQYQYKLNDKGKIACFNKYMIVMNYAYMVGTFGQLPYEIWAKTDLGSEELTEKLNAEFGDSGRYLDGVTICSEELKQEQSTAILQITNGLFTADFIIALLLCIIGYMIYWITSIRDRELLFGIYRAMGISRGEINRMIGIEQIFMSLMSIAAGVVAGTVASKLFAKVFAAVYLPQKHNIKVFISSYGPDLIKLAVLLLVVVFVCVFWIRRIVRGLKITEALKLGDD